ncbi:MAG: alpha-ketoacid dehydrogenase subunit beta [Planctomycetota bacterium]
MESGAATPGELRALIADTRARVRAAAREAARRPRLERREQVTAPLAPYDVQRTADAAAASPNPSRRQQMWGERLPEQRKSPAQRNLSAHVNAALFDLMIEHPEILIFGEDVGKKGGVYGVTKGLQQTFSERRVFDTLLDETTILGVAQGAGQLGFLPMPEIQYLAYVHNALDQLRGEACSLSFFSDGAFTNPMVVRIAGLAYQKGFGGHFHNDNSIGALRDIPGLAIACPSRGDEAAKLLRGCTALAQTNGRVVVFLEPIALYHERDLYEDGDGGWLCDYPEPGKALLPGEVGVHHAEATDLLIISYANGLRLSLRAARRLEQETGKKARVVDLRWLAPLPHEALRAHAADCGRVLVVDECRRTGGGVAEALIADLAQTTPDLKLGSVCAADSYVPLGTATDAVLVTEDQILAGAVEVLS